MNERGAEIALKQEENSAHARRTEQSCFGEGGIDFYILFLNNTNFTLGVLKMYAHIHFI